MKREPIFRKALVAIIAALCFMLPNAGAQNLDKGLKLIDMDQFHNAIGFFKDIAKQTPTNADAWYYVGLCYCNIDNVDSASIAFNSGLTADPKNPSNVAGQAIVQHFKNNDVQAKATFAAAAKMNQKKYPNGLVSILKGYALCKFTLDPFIDGVYKKAVETNMKNPYIYLSWGDIQYASKEYGPAATAYSYASTYDPKNALSHYLLGKMYNAARNYTAALADLDAALEIDPMFVPAIKEKGDAYYELKKFDDAAIWYDKYIQLTEETAQSLIKYANILFFAKKYDKTHEIITKVLKLEPGNPYMLRLMGWVSFETKNYADGLDALAKYFKLKDDTAKMIHPLDFEYYAKLLQNAGNDSLAIVYYKKTLKADSSNAAKKQVFTETIGDLYLKQKKYVESAQYYEKLQQLRTGIDGRLQNKLGQNYQNAALALMPSDSTQKEAFIANPSPEFMNYFVKADSAYSKVCQSNPNIYTGFIARARLANILDPHATKGLAKPYYEKTVEVALANNPDQNKPQIIEGLKYLSIQTYFAFEAAQKAKDKEKSAQLKTLLNETLNKILAVDPNNSYASENLKLLNPPAKKPAPGAKK